MGFEPIIFSVKGRRLNHLSNTAFDTLIYPTHKCPGCPPSLNGVRNSHSSLRGQADLLRSYPLTLQSRFPYGHHSVSHHIGHTIRCVLRNVYNRKDLNLHGEITLIPTILLCYASIAMVVKRY